MSRCVCVLLVYDFDCHLTRICCPPFIITIVFHLLKAVKDTWGCDADAEAIRVAFKAAAGEDGQVQANEFKKLLKMQLLSFINNVKCFIDIIISLPI